ncbi:MAG: hypothetical protein KDA21_02675 [Phycisphaerales bacterium]|nr:hypothetical protein [Phycisphaerales bacterium]
MVRWLVGVMLCASVAFAWPGDSFEEDQAKATPRAAGGYVASPLLPTPLSDELTAAAAAVSLPAKGFLACRVDGVVIEWQVCLYDTVAELETFLPDVSPGGEGRLAHVCGAFAEVNRQLCDVTRETMAAHDPDFNPWTDIQVWFVKWGGGDDRFFNLTFRGPRLATTLAVPEMSDTIASDAPPPPGEADIVARVEPDRAVWVSGGNLTGHTVLTNIGNRRVAIEKDLFEDPLITRPDGGEATWVNQGWISDCGWWEERYLALAPGESYTFSWTIPVGDQGVTTGSAWSRSWRSDIGYFDLADGSWLIQPPDFTAWNLNVRPEPALVRITGPTPPRSPSLPPPQH